MKTMVNHLSTINCILIANRGEIASRISRTCRKLGIRSVAVYSEADRYAPFVQDADLAVFIGGSAPSESYLDQDKILEAAKKTGAQAIHPGYGFLSENSSFARKCHDENVIFIGPNPDAIEKMGLKSEAKKIMQSHEVPTIPGYQGDDQSMNRLLKESKSIGYPLLLKASAGGGGKGMRIVRREEEFENAVKAAQREAKNAFGNSDLIIEKYIESGRHIEFQIFGDQHGNVIHILERECSIQRRYQKVIEESPSPVMDDELRSKMGEAAVQAAKAIQYDNAGTVEFIFDERDRSFYFLEVNTRLQVEHPVTEAITGFDLVAMQIAVAEGRPLTIQQKDVHGSGYAIEARLYAEDPSNNFFPQSGKVEKLEFPKIDGLRIESAVTNESEVSIYYDPMIAKIVMHGRDRFHAISKLHYALCNTICFGLNTNLDFLIQLTKHEKFAQGQYDTHFIERHPELLQYSGHPHKALIAASYINRSVRASKQKLLTSMPSGWRNNKYAPQKEKFRIGDDEYEVAYEVSEDGSLYIINHHEIKTSQIELNENSITLEIDGTMESFQYVRAKKSTFIHGSPFGNIEVTDVDRLPSANKIETEGDYLTKMPATIVKVLVEPNQMVKSGDPLIVVSSMKMESTIHAHSNGQINEIKIQEGENVPSGTELLTIN